MLPLFLASCCLEATATTELNLAWLRPSGVPYSLHGHILVGPELICVFTISFLTSSLGTCVCTLYVGLSYAQLPLFPKPYDPMPPTLNAHIGCTPPSANPLCPVPQAWMSIVPLCAGPFYAQSPRSPPAPILHTHRPRFATHSSQPAQVDWLYTKLYSGPLLESIKLQGRQLVVWMQV